jgi:NAD(P)-dependent dehydrogenase (short-subunit alcohol dehydrogenase family)
MSGKLAGKVAVITGGGSGIGRATAIRFAAEGAKVVIGNRNEEKGEATVRAISAAGGSASFVRTDVTREGDVKGLVNYAVSEYGGQGIRINAVSPGAIQTDMLDRFAGETPEAQQQA